MYFIDFFFLNLMNGVFIVDELLNIWGFLNFWGIEEFVWGISEVDLFIFTSSFC